MEDENITLNLHEFHSINKIIQQYVNKVSKNGKFSDAQFIVSLEGKNSENIYLTIIDDNGSFSEKLYPPTKKSYYGLECICDVMEKLYNRIM